MGDENNMFESNEQQGMGQQPDYGEPIFHDNNDGPVKGQGTGLGIASMVLGILSIVSICCSSVVPFLPVILGIVSIVLGIVQIVKNDAKGMAIAGIICSVVGIIGYIALAAFGMYLLNSGAYDEILQQLEQVQ